jgi:AraC-like DNA-binding protein
MPSTDLLDRSPVDSARMHADRAELVDRILRALPEDGKVDALGGLFYLHRESSPTEPLHAVAYPSVCVMAQGAKVLHLGDADHRYDPFHYLLVTAELPISSEIVEASEAEPYLSLVLRLDPELVGQVMIEAGEVAGGGRSEPLALDVSPLGEDLLDAALRLVRLIDQPEEAGVVAPLVTREIVYRLLRGAQGARLRQVAALGGHSPRMAPAIRRLHAEFDRALSVEELAEGVGLSASRFHHHFKAVTGMTPVQFQKQLRLQEARRLLLADDLDAATAGYRVGYNSASHFSRDYRRLFGAPPMQDVERLRERAAVEA